MKYGVGILLFALTLSACAGVSSGTNGAGSVLPESAAINAALPSGIRITEYSLGRTPSGGGIAIAANGSIWTESRSQSNTNGYFVRWLNGSITSYALPNSSYYGLGIVTSNGQSIFGGFQNDNLQNYDNLI
ncbi:MAG: hypothetical protein JO165_03435, partial [Candidatus Eremiobacteraeota bacterium]|nr:hypothetical protein [Candidatus Eremiobacteraeota bacterium]